MMIGVGSACSFFESGNNGGFFSPTMELTDNELVPLTRTPAVPNILMPVASGRLVEKNSKAIIDYSNTTDGYIMVKWLTQTDKQLRVQVIGPNDATYSNSIWANDSFEVIPLADGSGSYTIRVLEQVSGDRYAMVSSLSVDVSLKDEFAPFLRPNQFVNFDANSAVVRKAAEIVAGKSDLMDKITAVYSFVISNITYDTNFANEIIAGNHKGYIPDVDKVLANGKGICFDYASLMTAMLRSQGVPTKLVIGVAGDVNHAWINVYSEETGWIDRVIFFDGESWVMMDPTWAAAASNARALQAFIGDGSSYVTQRLY